MQKKREGTTLAKTQILIDNKGIIAYMSKEGAV
jgi:hypothetical protein